MITFISLIVVTALLVYVTWLAVTYGSRAMSLQVQLDAVKRQLEAERNKVREALDADSAVRDDIDRGKLLDDDGYRRD